jgi:hypothetical protein
MTAAEFGDASGKSLIVGLIDEELAAVAPHLAVWARVLAKLPRRAAALYASEVKKIHLARPWGSEDASWHAGGVLRLTFKPTETPNALVYRARAVHELGHALEEKLGLVVVPWNSPYGAPPYVSDYAARNATEDWAECFRALELEPRTLLRLAPVKYHDLRARLGETERRSAYRASDRMETLRSKLIRLAAEQSALRADLLPLLRKATSLPGLTLTHPTLGTVKYKWTRAKKSGGSRKERIGEAPPYFRAWYLSGPDDSFIAALHHTHYISAPYRPTEDPAWKVMLRLPALPEEANKFGAYREFTLKGRWPSPSGDEEGVAEAAAAAVRAYTKLYEERMGKAPSQP